VNFEFTKNSKAKRLLAFARNDKQAALSSVSLNTISEENNFPARCYQSVRIALGAEPNSG
jgi:hypothetical protein